MYAKQVFFFLVITAAIAQALPVAVADKRYKLPKGATPIKVPHGTHAFRRESDSNSDLFKRIVIVAQDGTITRPTAPDSGRPQPDKRYIIDGPDGTAIRPTPLGPGHEEPLKRYIIEKPDGTFIAPTPRPGGIVPL